MPGLYFDSGIDNGFNKDLARMRGNMEAFAGEVEMLNAAMAASFGTVAKSVAGLISVAAIGAAGKELVGFSIELETALTEVSTVSQEVTNNFEDYKEQLIALSTTSQIGAVELTKAFYDIVSAGYDGARGMDILRASQQASVAGFVEVGVAADGLTTVLNAWGLKAEESAKVSDIFFKSVELGKTTFPELASNIAQVAPIAASMDVSFEEMAGAVATLTKSGTPTAQALTQIRASLLAANEVLGDGWGKTMTYQEAMVALADKAGGSTNKLQDMVGRVEAVNAVLATTGKNAAGAASDLEAMNGALGATEKAASKVVESTSAKIGMLKNNILAALEPLGNKAKEVIGDLAVKLSEAFESGQIEKYAKVLMQLTKAFIVYKASGIALNAVQKIRIRLMEEAVVQTKLAAMAGKQLSQAEALAAARATLLSNAQRGLVNGVKSLTAAFAANPIGMIVTALTLAMPAITSAVKAFESSSHKLKKVNEEIGKAVAEETSGLQVLQKQLNSNNLSTERKKQLIEELNTKYGQYLPYLLTEQSTQEDINKAIEIANKNLEKQIRLRVLNTKAEETYARIYELEEKIKKRQGQKFLNNLLKYTTTELNAFALRFGIPVKELTEQKELYEQLLKEIGQAGEEAVGTLNELPAPEPGAGGGGGETPKPTSEDEKENLRKKAIEAIEIENQTRLNELAKRYLGEKELEDEYNRELLNQKIDYLTKLRAVSKDALEKLKIDEELINAKKALEADEEKEQLNELLIQYADYSTKRKAIEDDYQKKIDLLRKNGYETQAQEAEKAMQIEIDRLDAAIVSANQQFQDWSENTLPALVTKGMDALSEELSNLKVRIQTENLDPETLRVVLKEIEKIEKEIASVNNKTKDTKDSWKDLLELLNNVDEFIRNITSSMDNADENTKALLQGIGTTVSGIIGMAQSVKMLSGELSTMEKASVILTIIGTAIKVISAVTTAMAQAQEARRQNYIDELNKIEKINLALIEQNRLYEEGNSFFADDRWGTALRGLTAYNQALKFQNELMMELSKANDEVVKKEDGTFSGLYRKTSFGSGSKEAKQLFDINQQAKGYATALEQALAGIDVKTKDKSSFANFFGVADQYSSLLKMYPELIDVNGELNTTLLKTLMESEDLSDMDKARLENLIEVSDKAQEAYAQFGEYISSIFGNVGDDITQAFQSMYESGGDAMNSLEQSFSDMIESFTRDAIEFSLLQPLIDELNSTTKAIGEKYAKGDITADDLQKGIVDTIGGFYDSLNQVQPQILQAFESADALAQKAGFTSAFSGSETDVSSSSKAGAISQSITEETGSMMVGRMGAIMLSNERIANLTQDTIDYAIQNLVTLNKIKENTDYLPVIADNTRKTYEKLESI